jgi:hypothetical protein
MRLNEKLALCSLLTILVSAVAPQIVRAQDAAVALKPSRIVEAIDDSKLITLRGNVHPGAIAANDRGALAGDTPLNRIVMVLQRSPEQETALEQFMAEQKDPSSPNFHHWLTPEQFGQSYGPSDQDVAAVTAWLQSHGFVIDNVSVGRVTIEFSGTAAQVASAFHTEIHNYVVNGVAHIANNSDPQIPEALAPVVQGIASLHNFFPTHQHVLGQRVRYNPKTGAITPIDAQATPAPLTKPSGLTPAAKLNGSSWSPAPQLTYSNANGYTHEDVTPYDFATIYNVLPLWNAGINGTGQTIAISGVNDINLSDVATFQSVFGLPSNPPTIIHNGTAPGTGGGTGENELDVEWSGAVAPKAKIVMVVTNSTSTTFGGQLSDSYIVDNKTASIMSASYGMCELKLGSSGNAAYNSIWQQGAAEGISIMESSGDQGSAGCASQDTAAPNADTTGLVVNGMASSPYVTAVGGTDFYWQGAPSTYWNSSNNGSNGLSAKGYVPEEVWNSTCASSYLIAYWGASNGEQLCNSAYDGALASYYDEVVIGAGSGGVSNCTAPTGTTVATCAGGYAKPSWQTGTGVPADGKRDVPDVSLFASSGLPNGLASSAYLVCETINTSTCDFSDVDGVEMQEIGGTSASSPAFAGIMALVLQKTGEAQGLANVELYKFFGSENLSSCKSTTVAAGNSCIFYDVTLSNNSQVCITGDPDCVTNTSGDQLGVLSGYSAGVGYDKATGLGSVNVTNLVNAAWPKSGGTSSPAATLSPTTLAFGNETVGVTSAAKTATLTNSGGGTLTVTTVALSGATSSFAESNTCLNVALAAGKSCTFTVTFDPNGAVAKTLTVSITDNVGTQTLEATGTGVAATASVSVTPATLAFGNETVGVKSAAKTSSVKNTGSSPVTISINTTGATSSFAETNNCGSLAAGATCTITVTFDPSAAVYKTETITVSYAGGSQTVMATGTGVAAGVSLSATTVAFGNQSVNEVSSAKTSTLTNNTSGAVTISSIASTGATSSFQAKNNCPASLAKGASCTFTITFDPSAAVYKTLTITIKDTPGTQTLTATGTGVSGVTVSPASLSFGNQTVGVKSSPKAVTVKNTGTGSASFSGITASGATSSFTETNNCPNPIAAGASCTVEITFDPNGAVAKTATFSLTDATGTQSINVSGTGVAP